MALVTRLRTIRSTRRASASATQGRPVVSAVRTTTWMPERSASGRVESTTRWARSTRLTSSRSSTAAPASNLLISSRSESSSSKRSSSFCSSSAARAVGGSKRSRASCSTSPAIRTVVSGVRSSWETSETNRRCTRESSSSWRIWLLQAGGHLVERRAEAGDVVVAAHVHALLEPSRRQTLGHPSGQPHRRHHLPGDQPGDPADQEQQQHRRGDQGPPYQREGALLLGHREEVVERVGAAVGRQRDLRTGDDPRHGRRPVAGVVADGGVGVRRLVARALVDLVLAAARGCCLPRTPGVVLVPAPAARPVAEPSIGPREHDLVALHRAARDQRRDQLCQLRAGVEVGAVRRREPALCLCRRPRGLGHRGVGLARPRDRW